MSMTTHSFSLELKKCEPIDLTRATIILYMKMKIRKIYISKNTLKLYLT